MFGKLLKDELSMFSTGSLGLCGTACPPSGSVPLAPARPVVGAPQLQANSAQFTFPKQIPEEASFSFNL